MRLSKTELKVLEQVSKGKNKVKEVAGALKRDKSQVYRAAQKLREKGLVSLEEGAIAPGSAIHITLLLQLLAYHPSVLNPLSNCGIEILTSVIEPKSMKELSGKAGAKRSMAYHKLKEAERISLVNAEKGRYFLNRKIWPKAEEFLTELKKHENNTDRRVPPGSIIYFKTEKEIVFSCKEKFDAALTAFSAFGKFGIKLLLPFNFYCLPKKKLGKKEVFVHALHVAGKEKTASNLAHVALFYLKHRRELSGVKSEIIKGIRDVLRGKKLSGYPSLSEIREKAELYDIKL